MNREFDHPLSGDAVTEISRRRFVQGAAAGGALLGTAGLAGTAGAATRGKRGGTLRYGVETAGQPGIEPHKAVTRPDIINQTLVYNWLLIRDDRFRVRPQLAEDYSPNADRSQWTFKLRKGVEFHNGKTVTSDDVLASFQRILTPSVAANSFKIFGTPLPKLVRLRKLDARTVRFELDGPNGVLDELIAEGYNCGIIPVGWDVNKPIGTGPFICDSYQRGSRGVFKRNPNYFLDEALFNEVITIEIPDPAARLNALYSGQIDAASNVPANQTNAVLSKGFNMLRLQSGRNDLLIMGSASGPFSDPNVRLAMKLAIDRKALRRNVYNGAGIIGNDVLGYADPYFDKDLERKYDPERAKSLVQRNGRTSVNLSASTRARDIAYMQILQQQVAKAGINLQVSQYPDAQHYSGARMRQPLRFDGNPSFGILYNELTWGTYGSFFYTSGWTNEKYTQLKRNYVRARTTAARRKNMEALQKIIFDSGPYLSTVYTKTLVGHVKKLRGMPTIDAAGLELTGVVMPNLSFA